MFKEKGFDCQDKLQEMLGAGDLYKETYRVNGKNIRMSKMIRRIIIAMKEKRSKVYSESRVYIHRKSRVRRREGEYT